MPHLYCGIIIRLLVCLLSLENIYLTFVSTVSRAVAGLHKELSKNIVFFKEKKNMPGSVDITQVLNSQVKNLVLSYRQWNILEGLGACV